MRTQYRVVTGKDVGIAITDEAYRAVESAHCFGLGSRVFVIRAGRPDAKVYQVTPMNEMPYLKKDMLKAEAKKVSAAAREIKRRQK